MSVEKRRLSRSVWDVLYRLILKCYPPHIYQSAATDMADTFADLRRMELRRRGFFASVVFSLRAILEVPIRAATAHKESWFGNDPMPFNGKPQKRSRTGRFVETIILDLRYAARSLRKRPLFTLVAILTLGLGIGAATAIFSVIDGVLLRPLPYRDPGRLVTAWIGYPQWGQFVNLRYDQYRLWRSSNTHFEDVAIYLANSWGHGTLTGAGQPERVSIGTSTASLLPVLGVSPAHGRWFTPDEIGTEPGGAAPVAVVSHALWSRLYGEAHDIVGRTIELDGITRTIIGVLPDGFRLRWLTESPLGTREVVGKEVWLPLGQLYDCFTCGSSMYQSIGRLKPGISFDQATDETLSILAGTATSDEMTVRVVPREEDETRGLGSPLALLISATGLLLLIACGNIAMLSLGEMQGRAEELATRSALGAGRGRITRQLLTESLLLGLGGSVVGVLVAWFGTQGLLVLAPPIPRIDQVGVNGNVLMFATMIGIVAGLVFGTIPSIVATRSSISGTLRAAGRTGSARNRMFQRVVVVLEVAFTAVLLVTGGLLTRSLSRLLNVNPGFASENLATMHVSLPESRYEDQESHVAFVNEVLQLLSVVPGVRDVTAANGLPFPGTTAGWAVRDEEAAPNLPRLSGKLFHVDHSFHDALRIPLLEGRLFNIDDGPNTPSVAIVSQTLARRLWPNESPIGRRLVYPWTTVTVVGVVGDVRRRTLGGEPDLDFYVPFSQLTRAGVSFAVRTQGDPTPIIPQIRDVLWSVDGDLAISRSGSMESFIESSASDERFRTLLMTVFGMLAASLAAVGVFGVTARSVALRRREMGIRMALGAQQTGMVATILRRSVTTGIVGIAFGIAGALWVSRLVSGFLFDIEPTDPVTYGLVAASLTAVCLLASFLPARRIARVSPVEVLRSE